jgi:hypothetical protein
MFWPIERSDIMSKTKIKAECHSDDYFAQVEFDAELWFLQATDQEIQALMECDWRGDYPADAVAMFMQSHHSKLKDLFDYVVEAKKFRDSMGFEVSVEEKDALKWLRKYRPHLVKE